MTNHLIRYFDMFVGNGSFQCVSYYEINKYANAIGHCIRAVDEQFRKEVSSA